MFYQGSSNGRFSYIYSGNFGDNSERLMYVPNNASELNFEEFTSAGRTVTVQEQQEAFDAYIDSDDYLSSIRGQVSERNGAVLPWVNRFDFRLLQDIPLGKHKLFGAEYQHKFQLTLDILNIGNLFNSAWGVQQTPVQRNLLTYRGRTDNNEPIYRLNFVSGTSEFPTEFSDSSTRNEVNLGQTWRAQIGIRYIFN